MFEPDDRFQPCRVGPRCNGRGCQCRLALMQLSASAAQEPQLTCRMRKAVRVMAAVLIASACPSFVNTSPANATTTSGCGTTRVRFDGRLPSWTHSARPPAGIPYATSSGGNVVAILFGYPLHSGHPSNHSNKILWIMRQPRDGQPLLLAAHPLSRSSPIVETVGPADSCPGEIYPSFVDVPSAGCWHVTLAWNHHHATFDLRYSEAPAHSD